MVGSILRPDRPVGKGTVSGPCHAVRRRASLSATVLLGAASVAASWIPALRATRVDPVEVMRQD